MNAILARNEFDNNRNNNQLKEPERFYDIHEMNNKNAFQPQNVME